MPLRYLQLPEPQYVPSYNALQPELVDRAHSAIQQQGEDFIKQQRDFYDVASANVAEEIGGLSERDRQYVSDQFTQSRERINQIVEQHGARNAMPFLDEEIRRINSEIRPLQSVAEKRNAAIERLQENDQIPNIVRQSVIGQEAGGVYDEETGRLIGTNSGINESDLEIAANWEDWTDDVQEFVSNMSANVQESGEFSVSPQETARYRQRLKSLGFDEISSGTVAFLMSNPKYKEQLDLLGRIEFERERELSEQRGIRPRLSIDDSGRLKATVRTLVTDTYGNPIEEGEDEAGNPIYKTRESNQTFGSFAEYKATEIGSTYGRQSLMELTYSNVTDLTSERAKGKRDNLIPRFTGRMGLPYEDQDIRSFISSSYEQASVLNDQYASMQNDVSSYLPHLFPNSDADYTIDDETGELSFVVDGTSHTLDSLLENQTIDRENYSQLKDLEMALQSTRNKAQVFEQNFDQGKVALLNELIDIVPEDRDFILENVEITDEGLISIRDGAGLSNVSNKWKGWELKVNPYKFQSKDIDDQSRELLEFRRSGSDSALINVSLKDGSKRPVYVERGPGDSVSFYRVNSSIERAIGEAGQKAFQKLAGSGYYDTATVLLNRENDTDKQIIRTVEDIQSIGTSMGEGSLLDGNGNTISFDYDEGMRLSPERIFIGSDGRATIAGTMYNVDGRLKDSQTVFWQGDVVESMLRTTMGDDYDELIADLSFQNMMPTVYDQGSVTFSAADLMAIGAFKNVNGRIKTLDNVTVDVRKNRNIHTNRPTTTYSIRIPGRSTPLVTTNQTQIRRLILNATSNM